MSLPLSPLRLPAVRRLLTAYAVNATGNWLGEIALSLLILRATGSVLAVATLWVLGRFAPSLVAPALLARVQRRYGSRLLFALHAGEAAVFAALTACAVLGLPVVLLLALAALDGVFSVGARALIKAAVVCTSRPAGLHEQANALLNLAFTVSFAAGPALAGLLVASLGASTALALDALSFLGAAIALGPRLHIPNLHPQAARSTRDLRSTLGELLRAQRLRTLLLADSAANILFALIIPVEMVFATKTLGASPAAFGVVLAAWGSGAVLGSALLVRLSRVNGGVLVVASYAAMIASYLGMGCSPSIAPVIAFSFLGGVGNGIEGCAMLTALQREVSDQMQLRLNSVLEALHGAVPGIGFLLGGVIASVASPRATYVVAGLGALIVLSTVARRLCSPVSAGPSIGGLQALGQAPASGPA